MIESLNTIEQIFNLNDKLYDLATREISDEDARKRINGRGNPFLFLAGHVLASRYFICSLIQVDVENPLGDQFNGSFDENTEYSPLDKVTSVFHEFAPVFHENLRNVDPSILSGELQQPFPVEEQKILNGLIFLAGHESYHIGQMGYQLVQLGYTSIYDSMFADA